MAHRPHLKMKMSMIPFTPSSPSPSPISATPTSAPTTYFLSSSPSVPSIIITPPPTFPHEVSEDSNFIAQARKRRIRRASPPSPDLLCVGWRRRPDSFPGTYGLLSGRARRCTSMSVSASSAALSYVAGAIASLSEMDIQSLAASAFSASVGKYLLEKKEGLPLYTRRRRTRRPRPLALFALLFTVALGLSLVLHGGIAALDTPIAQRSHTGSAPRHAFGHTVSGRYYETRQHPRAAAGQITYHPASSAPNTPEVVADVDAQVGVKLATRGYNAAEMRDIVDAFSRGVLNPWDFH